MNRLKYMILVAASLLFISCIQEIAPEEIAVPIAGSWAEVDGDMLSSHYIVFSNGVYQSFTAADKRYVHDGYIMHSNKADFRLKMNSRYSLESGKLIYQDKSSVISVKDDVLTLDGKKYVKMNGMKPERYFSISLPEGDSIRHGYGEETVTVPVTVENESFKYELVATPDVQWIKDIRYSGGKLSFTIDKSTADRNGVILLQYFDAEDVVINVRQEVDRFINLSNSSSLDYRSQDHSISYSITNPVKDARPSVSTSVQWIKDIVVNATSVSFHVEENPSQVSRSADFVFEYDEAHPARITITQTSATTQMTIEKDALSADYKAQTLTLGYTLTNPRDGLAMRVQTINNWISVVSTDNKMIRFNISENTSGGARMGSLTVSYGSIERKVTVAQSYIEPSIQISDFSVGFSSGSKTVPFTITNGRTGGTVSAATSANWLSSVSISGSNLSFNVAANNTGSDRKADIVLAYKVGTTALASKTISISQNAPVLGFDKNELSFSYTASSKSFAIDSDCDWSISSSQSWVSASPASSSGSSSIKVSASANTSGANRSATLTVKNTTYNISKTISVIQEAPLINLSETQLTPNFGTETFSITVDANVAWTVSSPSWISVTPSSGSSGKTTIKVTTSKNGNESSRTGTVTVASSAYGISSAIPVTQKAFSKSFNLLGDTTWSISTPAASTTQRTVRANFTISVSSSAPWLTTNLSSIPQGETDLILSATNNDTGSARNATVTLSNTAYGVSQVISVSQIPASITTDIESWGPAVDESSTLTTVISNCDWTASSDASWLTLDKTSSTSGTNSIVITAAANKSVTTRSATVTITNPAFNAIKTIPVTQAAFVPQLSINSSSWTPNADAQTSASFTITSNVNWTVSSDVSWLTVSNSSGSGNGSITLSVTNNTSTSASRTGTVTINDPVYSQTKTITVTQAAFVPQLSINSSSWAPNADAQTSASFTITSNVNWTVSSDVSWLTVSNSSGSGNGSITLSVTNNTSTSASRTGIVTINDPVYSQTRTITVTQAKSTPSITASLSSWAPDCSSQSSSSISITSNVSWTATSSASWLTVSKSSGVSGTTSMTLSATQNSSSSSRTATVTIKNSDYGVSRTISVTQGAVPVLKLTGSGSYPWVKSGTNTIQSNNYHVSSSTSTSTITFTTTSTTTLSFNYQVSSESSYDKLTIKVDGTTKVNAISGTQSSTITVSNLSSGSHTISLSYSKDSSVNKNNDRGYISNITLYGHTYTNSEIK